ncbi:phage replisome organizer N-terminal domain-containing protein [Clostridium sporogenes]
MIIIAKKYYWLKLKEDFFRQKEIKKLRKIAGGDTYTIIYLKMMLLSLKDEGKLFFEGLEDSFIDEVALEIDEDLENVKVTIMFLIKCRLIEEVTENEFLMTKAYESIGSETQSAERVRRFRERKKQQELLQCNTLVTKCNTEIEKDIELDIEKDTELEKKKKKKGRKKEGTKKTYNTIIDEYTENEELKNTILEFIKMRTLIKSKMTNNALDLMLKNLNKLSNNDDIKIKILEQSIMNSWKGVFPLKESNSIKQNSSNTDSSNPFLNMLNGGM